MAHPWLFENTPAVITTPFGWTSETDTRGALSVKHYTHPKLLELRTVPFRGAYLYHIDQSIGTVTTTAIVTETSGFDTAAEGVIWVKFYYRVKDLVMAANDRFTVFALDSAGPVVEVAIDVLYTAAAGLQLAMGDGTTSRTTSLIPNKWHCIEFRADIDAGGGDDGTLDFFVDGYQVGAQITGVDQAAITQARMGIIGGDAGTTSGHLFFNHIVADDAQIFPFQERWPDQVTLTQTAHVFVGPGAIGGAAILSTTAGNTCKLYDTDLAYSSGELDAVVDLSLTSAASFQGPIFFQKGCYAVLGGTNPKAQVFLDMDASYGEAPGPIAYGGEGHILSYAAHRKARIWNVG